MNQVVAVDFRRKQVLKPARILATPHAYRHLFAALGTPEHADFLHRLAVMALHPPERLMGGLDYPPFQVRTHWARAHWQRSTFIISHPPDALWEQFSPEECIPVDLF